MPDPIGIAYQKGRFMPTAEAKISILNPAFTKSDVVFDVVSVWERSFFRLDDHMQRFRASREDVRMSLPESEDEIKHILAQCVDRAGLDTAMVYMLSLRGHYGGNVTVGDLRTCKNEFIALAVPYYWVVPQDRVQTGAHLWIAETRRAPDVAINQRNKNFNRMDLTRAQFEALDAGADSPLLLSTGGYLTEGPGYNLWIIRDGKALTPGDNILHGITRLSVFELCSELGLEASAANLQPDDLYNAKEAFISSSGGGVFPVALVNHRPIGTGKPGDISRQLHELYWAKRKAGWHATPMSELLALAPDARRG